MFTFTKSQARAIESDSRNILCCAGAGSGKTRILTERIVRMLTIAGVKPSELLVLTFTRRAANEMKGRLIERLGGGDDAARIVSQVTMGTFHSVALRILRTWGHLLGYDAKALTVVSPTDADTILRQVGSEFGIYVKGKYVKGASWAKLGGWREAHYTGATTDEYSETEKSLYGRIFDEYCNRLRTAQALDFGLILMESKRLLSEFDDVRAVYNRTIKHVFVDESQDLDAYQHSMLFYFWPPATMFFVGDLRQSIYGFRNAEPDLLRKLVVGEPDKPSDFEVIDLENCFRCSSRIVEAANRLIAHNEDPLAKAMISATGSDPGNPTAAPLTGHVEAFTGTFADVVRRTYRLVDEDMYQPSDIAILARTHEMLRQTEAAFNHVDFGGELSLGSGIRVRRVRGTRDIFAADEFCKLHAALRLIVNRRDRVAFDILAADLGLYSEGRLRAHVVSNDGTPIFDAFLQSDAQRGLGSLIGCLSPDHAIGSAVEQIAAMIDGNPYESRKSAAFWTREPGKTVDEALREFSMLDFEKGEDAEEQPDAVTLMTVHAAKGLEFSAVIVVGMNDGKFPSKTAMKEGSIKEERCAAYVAITRARTFFAAHHLIDPEKDKGGPSQFIGEAGIEFKSVESEAASVGG